MHRNWKQIFLPLRIAPKVRQKLAQAVRPGYRGPKRIQAPGVRHGGGQDFESIPKNPTFSENEKMGHPHLNSFRLVRPVPPAYQVYSEEGADNVI